MMSGRRHGQVVQENRLGDAEIAVHQVVVEHVRVLVAGDGDVADDGAPRGVTAWRGASEIVKLVLDG